jgi:hypothetical protein
VLLVLPSAVVAEAGETTNCAEIGNTAASAAIARVCLIGFELDGDGRSVRAGRQVLWGS